MSQPTDPRRIVPGTRGRDAGIAVGAGLLVLGFVLYAVYALGKQASSSGGVNGVIVAKEFVSRPETQVTVEKAGVSARQVAGEYILRVRVPEEGNKIYRVYVDPNVYQSSREGENFYFVRPK